MTEIPLHYLLASPKLALFKTANTRYKTTDYLYEHTKTAGGYPRFYLFLNNAHQLFEGKFQGQGRMLVGRLYD